MSEKTREQHIAMMSSPADWPAWPVLPVVNRNDRPDNLLHQRAGCMFASVEKAVILRNMFVLPPNVPLTSIYQADLANGQAIDYPSIEALYDAGWRVD